MLLPLLALPAGGCQWVLPDIGEPNDASMQPVEPDDRAGEGGSAFTDDPDLGAAQDGGVQDARVEPRAGDAASSVDAAGSAMADGSVDPPQDAGSDGRGPGTPPSDGALDDGALDEPDTSTACSAPVWWYQDADRDGYGRSSSRMEACGPGRGSWAREAGDCNDDDPRVHPNQPDYFDVAYQAPDGSQSFDYDCSGMEEGNGQQATMASDACGLLSLALCGGSGYLPVRAGAPNPWCGSHQKATCQAAALGLLLCEAKIDEVIEPYWCR